MVRRSDWEGLGELDILAVAFHFGYPFALLS
jgi:hypothetical protein